MTQTPKLAYPSTLTDPELNLFEEPRFLFLRVSLERAQAQDSELRRLAQSSNLDDSQTALAILQSEAMAAPVKTPIAACWEHSNASFWLLHTSADSEAFFYSHEELYIASVFCAAELQVSRDASMSDLEHNIFDLVASADKLITGWWQGRQLGLVKFLATAAKHNGATISQKGVEHRAWGLGPSSEPADLLRAIKDLSSFSSSLHLTAWKLGAWPVHMTGTQTTMSLGWIIRYLFDFALALPKSSEFFLGGANSSSDSDEPAKKRKITQGLHVVLEATQAEKMELEEKVKPKK